ncbi:MAG TPA: DMT family transporter [Acidimicrobiia bacterium]|nr:DMT family transporter [Acidimicrobiia bacterium]
MSRPVKDLFWSRGRAHGEGRPTRLGIYTLLVTVVLVLGLNWPVMATGIQAITPLWMGAFRVAGAAIVVITIGVVRGKLALPLRADLPILISLAVFRLAAVFVLVFTALQLVPPGRSSVVVWTTSLWTVPIAAIFLGERMSGRRWVGLLLGIAGVIVVFEPWSFDWDNRGVALGHGLLILAAITNAATSVHIRRHRWAITPLEAIPWQLIGATALLVVLGLAVEGVPAIHWTPQLILVVLYQGVLATGIAFWAQIVILRNLSAVSTNLTLMAVPVVGVVSSAILLGEQITVSLAIGLVLVVIGVAINLLAEKGKEGFGPPVVESGVG